MKKHPVIITAIRPTANNTYQLMLSQLVEKELNAVQFFMKGHDKFPDPKPRVCFSTVSEQQMEQFKFKVGDDLGKKTKIDWNIEAIEGYEPFGKTKDPVSEELVDQLPKKNPATGQILTKNGKPIYRTTRLTRGESNDILIQHDPVNFVVREKLPEVTGKEILKD